MNGPHSRILMIICTCLLASYGSSYGQKSSKKLKVYTARITTREATRIKGVLEEVGDSSVLILTGNQRISVPVSSLQDIKIKRKGAVGRGALAGGLTGFGLGYIIGFASGDDECPQGSWFCGGLSAEEKALGIGTLLAIGGAVTGIIIGSVSRAEKLIINGDQGTFNMNVETMKKYAIQNNL